MTPDRWKLIDEFYYAALELPVGDRPAFLQSACAGDDTLRREVEKLIHAHNSAGDFLAAPALEDLAVTTASVSTGNLAGRQINHYQIVSLLGSGGMGEVYRAHDSKLDRHVAIKVLLVADLADSAASLRLIREARTASKLNHPNICTIYEVGDADGQPFIAMELVEGEPLSALLSNRGFRTDEILRGGLQMADALAHAHARGVVHRDFKSANVMMTSEGRIKVLDFGLAKTLNRTELDEVTTLTEGSLTQPGLLIGTLSYMAPEQLRGGAADSRSDVWALGVVLYEMAARVRPFVGQTTLDLSSAILAKAPAPLPGVSSKLQSIIFRCLEKDPERRYADASEARAALEQIQPSGSVAVPLIEHVVSHSRAYKFGVAVALIALIASGWALVSRRGAAPFAAFRPARPLTSFVGWEVGPSWSPDGNLIAYSHIVNSSADVAILPIKGGEPRVLTADSPADEFLPRFSPDGSKILFASDRGAGTNLYLIPFVGGSEQPITQTHIPFLQRIGSWAVVLGANPWSPDGTEIVFSRLHPNGPVALWKRNLSTGMETQLTFPASTGEDNDAAWSPDGKRIAFDRQGSIWVVSPQGGEPSELVKDASSPAWRHDGHGLVFTRGTNLWETDLTTGDVRQLTSGPHSDMWPAVARDGAIAYSQYDHEVNVYWQPVGGAQNDVVQLTSSTNENFGPRLSMDGSRVLYYSRRTGDNEVWIGDRKTGKDQNLSNDNAADDRLADWSPDGKEIVFMSSRGGSYELWIVKTDGSGIPRPLTHQQLTVAGSTMEAEGGPRWSPDGERIAYIAPFEGGTAVWTIAPDGTGASATVARNAISFGWYKDGRRLLYIRQAQDGSGLQELVAADLVTGKEQLLLKRSMAELAVAADGGALSFVDAVSHFTMNLWELRLKPTTQPGEFPIPDGRAWQITDGKGAWHVHNGGLSADGKAVVYSRDKDFGDIYVIEPKK